MTRINTNVSSINAQMSLARSNVQLQEALTRLSTGLRINSGKDDPAGLIASEALRSDIISVKQAVSNSVRANQVIATADSALGQVSALLNDIRGLVTEAANEGAMSVDQIAANQLQVDSSLEALNRIAQTTSFQGRRLLDGSLDFVTGAGAVASIEDLQIDQANLGAAGAIAVDVDISVAAAQGKIYGASGTQQAVATLNFAAGVSIAFDDLTAIDINAAALGTAESGVKFTFVDDVAAGSESASYDADLGEVTVHFSGGNTATSTMVTKIGGLDEFTAKLTTADGTLAATDDATTGTTGVDSITITAATAGPDFNDVTVKLATETGLGATPKAVYHSGSKMLVITVDDTATVSTALADIKTKVDALAEFSSEISASGTGNVEGSGADANAVANTGASGYLKSVFSASTNATATLSFAAGAALTLTVNGGATTAVIDLNATALGTTASDVTVSFVDDAAGAGQETVDYDAQAKTLAVHYKSADSAVTDIVAVLDAMDEFSAVKQSGTDAHKINAGQTTFTTGVDSLEITALIPGADYNNLAISVVTQNGLGAAGATATYDATANTLVIAIDDTEVTDLQTIDNAIDGLKEFASAKSAKGTDRVTGSGADANATANTEATGGNLLLDELVVEIGGSEGSEVFFFEKDASVNQVVQAISLVSDATGVTASQSHGLLSLISSRYGSAGFVEINVISEGGSGEFKDNVGATRQSGTDIAATVNGITANGDGNVLSINTAALDMSITVTAGSSTNFEFNITGGGALFQLGPDVVSNQQARLGIQSVNTTKLRGQNGRLYQLGSGESAALDTNPTLAAKIVDQVINKVTSLRGRLGAFQKTTLDTNINSLNDTLENLTDAESTIRDADFAAESAALTRSQILVQSGVSVLAIANTNPQNVLALLR